MSFFKLFSALLSHEIRVNHNKVVDLALEVAAQPPEENYTSYSSGRSKRGGHGGGHSGGFIPWRGVSFTPAEHGGIRRSDPFPRVS